MKVSIITISYNNLNGLKDTYKSIRSQTFRDFEWIVVDGGSSDGTKEFLEEHEQELAWWCSEKDKGVYHAQNKGTKHAKGEYSIYMNSGDSFFSEDVLKRVFDKDIDADIIYGNWMFVFEDGKKQLILAPEAIDLAYFFDDNICHQAMLIRTEAVKNRPYDESFRIYGDWEEWLALLMQGMKFERKDLTICNFMVGGISTDNNATEAVKMERKAEIKRIQERYYSEFWRNAMNRVSPILLDFKTMKSIIDAEDSESLVIALYERNLLLKKRKQHNKIIRILIIVSSLLLVANILTLLFMFCK